jgi:hypothetical protein
VGGQRDPAVDQLRPSVPLFYGEREVSGQRQPNEDQRPPSPPLSKEKREVSREPKPIGTNSSEAHDSRGWISADSPG